VSEILKVAITKFDPNPYQPKTRVDIKPETAEHYGKSILEHGLLQMPLARYAPFGKKGDRFEMGDGWLRLQGHKWLVEQGHLEFQEITVEVREIKDEQMAQLVFEANGVRKDLDPIETAQYFKKYMDDFKCTESQLAEKHSISQGEVANTMRLLQLPTDIQYLVASGDVPQTHARHLLRLNVTPDVQKEMVKQVVAGGVTVNRLSENIDRQYWEHSKSLNPKTDSYLRPIFDLGVCQGCVSCVEAADPYGQKKKEKRCILTSCWDKKQKEAQDKLDKEALAAAQKKGGDKILTSKTIGQGKYEFLEHHFDSDKFDRTECKTCTKKALFKYRLEDEDKPELVCLDPPCMRAKKSAFSREKNKADKLKDAELTEQLGKTFHQAHSRPTGVMIVVLRDELGRMRAEGKRDMMRMFPTLPKIDNGQMDTDAVRASLPTKSLEDLTDLAAAVVFTNLRREHCYDGSNNFSTVIKGDMAFDLAQLDGTGVECCGQTYNKQIQKDGRCKYSPAVKTEKEKPETEPTAGETKAAKPGKKAAKTETPAPAAGPGPKENVQGLLEVICDNKTLEAVYDTFSAASLKENNPKIKGLYELDGKQYVCTGAVLQGGKILEADCYVAVLIRDYDGKSVHASKKDLLSGYDGVFGSCNGFGYVLSGSVVKFVPGKVDNNKEQPMEKTKKVRAVPKPSASKKTAAKEEPIFPQL
jgi:ParB/RepB/Spo0J family partition protein